MALELRDITFEYSAATSFATRAIDGVSLKVESGELVLVLGSTGSGKSTLLRIASGLLAATHGTATVDGRPLGAGTVGSVGLVFQDPESQLFADTVADDVAFGPRNLGVEGEALSDVVERSLAAVGLDAEEFGPRSPFTLSGGEARRAAIAGVIAMRPSYLLLDEPTAGLDARGRAFVRGLINDARREAGVVVVSHAAEEFLGLADRVLLLADGRQVWQGTGVQLIDSPEMFTAAGLRMPEVLAVQHDARAHGAALPHLSIDPVLAAEALLGSGAVR